MLGLDFSHYPSGLLLGPTREKGTKKGGKPLARFTPF